MTHHEPLPEGQDDSNSPMYVAPRLRDAYATADIDPETALRQYRARLDHLEDLAAWERLAQHKQQRLSPDRYSSWFRAQTRDDPDNPGHRVPTLFALSSLEDRPQYPGRGTLNSQRELSEAEVAQALHEARLARAIEDTTDSPEPARPAPAPDSQGCRVCGTDGVDVGLRPPPGATIGVPLCKECATALPIVAALAGQADGRGPTRLELAAAYLDSDAYRASLEVPMPSRASVEAAMDAWLDHDGPDPLQPRLTSTPSSETGTLTRLRAAVGRQDQQPADALAPDAPGGRRRRRGLRR